MVELCRKTSKKEKSILDGNHCKGKKTLKIINATMFPGQQSGPEPQKMQSPDKPKKKKKTGDGKEFLKTFRKTHCRVVQQSYLKREQKSATIIKTKGGKCGR